MKGLEKLQKQAFKINNSDFLRAVEKRNFDEMADCYNEWMRYDNFGVPNDGNKYFFAEIVDGYVIHFPTIAKAKLKAIGTHFYYGLAEDYISYSLNECPKLDDDRENLVYAFFTDDFFECAKVVLTEGHITFTPKAIKQLKLSLGDIIKICFEEECIIIDKLNI